MASGSRAALRGAKGNNSLVNVVIGVIMIIIGLFIESTRAQALTVVTGIALVLWPLWGILLEGGKDMMAKDADSRLQEEQKFFRKKQFWKKLTLSSLLLGFLSQFIWDDYMLMIGLVIAFNTGLMWYDRWNKWEKRHSLRKYKEKQSQGIY